MTCKPIAQNPKPLEFDVEGFNRKCTFIIEAGDNNNVGGVQIGNCEASM